MDRWLEEIGDQPNLPEAELVAQLWHGSDQQPVTGEPEVSIGEGTMITVNCATAGASIGYKILEAGETEPRSWKVYTGPFEVSDDASLLVQAHRIGFQPSETIRVEPDNLP
jgi:hypothetical protein